MEEENTPLADIMINIGISEGKEEGRAEERQRIRKALDEIAEEHPGILLKDVYPLLQKKLNESSISSHSKL